jgi:hypothetical protein
MRLFLFAIFLLNFAVAGYAVEVYLSPDSIETNIGDTVTVGCLIGPSDLLRGYTVYLSYDTNRVKLAAPPLPGSVVSGQSGLNFSYFDHEPFFPEVLEVSATVFGDDFWQGPGDLFSARFVILECGDEPLATPYLPFIVDPGNNSVEVTVTGSLLMICERIPSPVSSLTVYPDIGGIRLSWNPVTTDTLNRPLLLQPVYSIFRTSIIQSSLPPLMIGSVADTTYWDSLEPDDGYTYYIVTGPAPESE